MTQLRRPTWIATITLLLASPAPGAGQDGGAAAAPRTVVTFDADKPFAPPADFEPVIGDWAAGEEAGAHGLWVDGSKWRQGTPSASLADQARRLYGERYAEFLDGVKAFAFFPLAVYRGDCSGEKRVLSVRFFPKGGRIDQGAGIAFAIQADGSYLGARANALETNLLFFRVVKGKRHIIDTIRGVETSSRQWHTLSVELDGQKMRVLLDGAQKLQRTLDAPPTGRCGLWSKADSQVLFDDFTIERR